MRIQYGNLDQNEGCPFVEIMVGFKSAADFEKDLRELKKTTDNTSKKDVQNLMDNISYNECAFFWDDSGCCMESSEYVRCHKILKLLIEKENVAKK